MDGADDVTQSDSAQDRRAFLKRMAAFAFAAPVISSFVLDSDAFADGHGQHGNNPPNQYGQNMTGQPPDHGKPPPDNQKPGPPPNEYGQNQPKWDRSQRRW